MPHRSIRLAALAAPLLLAGCGKNLVKVTYQQLANCPAFSLGDKSGSISGGMFQVFMLRGVVNQDQNAQDFTFNLSKVHEDNVTPGAAGGAWQIMNSDPLFLPVGFTTGVPKGSAFTVPYGKGVLFVIANEGAAADTRTYLNYKSSGSESVALAALDTKAPLTPCNALDAQTLAAIHSRQNDFENKYTPDGTHT